MNKLIDFIDGNRKLITPDDSMITYSGRIDFSNRIAPVFINPASSIEINFTSTSCSIIIENKRSCWDNYLGYILDGKQGKVILPQSEEMSLITIGENLGTGHHALMIFKRMDSCHMFTFYGLVLDGNSQRFPCAPKPDRKIEFYGDSVTAGEVSEAVEYVGKADPKHNGEYSNSYYSYAWFTARKLNAQIHNIAQGGISLLDRSGYFSAPNTVGILSTYDKIQYHPELTTPKQWDFSLYRPHVVVVAIGQNDSYPKDYMKEDFNGEEAEFWRLNYKMFIGKLREQYPKALIILATTILNHDKSWDESIDMVCNDLNDPRIKHFLYTNNGCGTDGHIRISEADKMSDELCEYISSFGDEIWKD